MFYKNCSCIAKTFYGVTFEPGNIREVRGIINDKMMVLVDGPAAKITKSTQQKPSPEKPKEESAVPVIPPSAPAQSSNIKEETAPAKDDDKSGKNKKS